MFYVSYDFTINQLPQHLEQAMYHDPFYSGLVGMIYTYPMNINALCLLFC